jgi:hypothetical protein
MARRGRTHPVRPAPGQVQTGLDSLREDSTEGEEERLHMELRRRQEPASALRFEDRVRSWVQLREEALRRRKSSSGAPPDPAEN